jgi:hypothetical protein
VLRVGLTHLKKSFSYLAAAHNVLGPTYRKVGPIEKYTHECQVEPIEKYTHECQVEPIESLRTSAKSSSYKSYELRYYIRYVFSIRNTVAINISITMLFPVLFM